MPPIVAPPAPDTRPAVDATGASTRLADSWLAVCEEANGKRPR